MLNVICLHVFDPCIHQVYRNVIVVSLTLVLALQAQGHVNAIDRKKIENNHARVASFFLSIGR